jgi:hypothetical protein
VWKLASGDSLFFDSDGQFYSIFGMRSGEKS